VRIHVKERLQDFARFNAVWTPTLSFCEADGTERHRFVGFYPLDEFQAQLALGVAKSAFGRRNFEEAQHSFEKLAAQFPNTDAAPEAVYWATASAFKVSGDGDFLQKGAEELSRRYPHSIWTKKATVWRPH
jgi:outer membrane protein assembly factor BamD (BamD/ComL family)